ncbi:MAG TPA: twin-arginine translocase subunit TatC [Chitinophagaceae bacterium]|nr:twin-arginine translocase subunit TatC [Chitinophagaceae bacterium]
MSVETSNRKSFFKKIRGKDDGVKTEMSFIDHLEVLRWHIVRSAIALLVAAITIFIFIDWIFDNIIYAPARENFVTYSALCNFGHKLHLGEALCMPPVKIPLLINTIGGSFTSAISICFMGGLIVAFPYLFWELWRFIKPALSPKETKYARGSTFWVSLCFFVGGAFGYFLLAPFTFNFLASFKLGTLGAQTYLPSLEDYIDTLVNIILGCGIAFELPVLAYVLSKIGLITPQFLKTYRKYAYVIILIVSAVITPSPDWTSQLIVGIPLVILYELSIFISARVYKNRAIEEKQWD